MLAKSGMFKRGSDTAASSLSSLPNANPYAAAKPAAPSVIPQAEPAAATLPAVAPERKAEALPAAEPASGSRLIVGPDVKLKGAEILDCDTLVVEGRVEATMDSRVIQIAEKGAFSGKVGIDVAEVHGRFDGELTARSQLVIHSTGRVSGKIRYGKILIEEGGELSGDVAALSSEHPRPGNLHLAGSADA